MTAAVEPISLNDALRFVEQVKYKPNWYINAHAKPDSFGGRFGCSNLVVVMTMRVPDVRDASKMIDVTSTRELPGMQVGELGYEGLTWWIHAHIMDMENHEADEWLRFAGERRREPGH